MKLLFMDEKGPQNAFRISSPFNMYNKLSYADDKMNSYVANVIQIDESDYTFIEKEYREIVYKYLSSRPQLKESLRKKDKELKGQDLLKLNFKFGIASMKTKEIQFYTDLLEVLLKYNVDNLLFLINKISIISSSRLINFLYYIDENTPYSAFIIKYIITKYLEVEASEIVIEAFLDKSIPTRRLLELVREDMKNIISKNLMNPRMERQIVIYEKFLRAVEVLFDSGVNLVEPSLPLKFDWQKVKWAFDLWITELNCWSNQTKRKLFLDEGIPKEIFKNLNFKVVEENCNSKDFVGLQITDTIVALIGKLVSKLNSVTKYDFDRPEKRVLVPPQYFSITEEQFNLIKKVYMFILEKEGKYHYVNDAYFDSSVILQSYLRHISSFPNYYMYTKVNSASHAEQHMKTFICLSEAKYLEGMKSEVEVKLIYGSIRKAIEDEIYRPL